MEATDILSAIASTVLDTIGDSIASIASVDNYIYYNDGDSCLKGGATYTMEDTRLPKCITFGEGFVRGQEKEWTRCLLDDHTSELSSLSISTNK